MKEQELIDNIMDNFDFRKVHQAMKALNWKWDRIDEIPEEHELRKAARAVLRGAIAYGFTGTGGFNARYLDGTLELYFVVTEWNSYFDEKNEVSCE